MNLTAVRLMVVRGEVLSSSAREGGSVAVRTEQQKPDLGQAPPQSQPSEAERGRSLLKANLIHVD